MAPHADAERAEVRRQQVLDAAAQCFREHGFHGASMALIARTAGMSPGHIYNLFENKEDIIGAIVARDQAQWLARAEASCRAPDVMQALLDDVALAVTDCCALPGAALRLEVAAEAGRNAKLAAVVQEADAGGRERVTMMTRAALAQRGADLPAPELRARVAALMALFDGLMVRSVRDPDMDRQALSAAVRRAVQALLQS